MNSSGHDEATKCLDRADRITERLKATKSLSEIATEVFQALHTEEMRPPIMRYRDGKCIEPTPKLAGTTTRPNLDGNSPGGLRGGSNPENLIAELVAAHVAPDTTSGSIKRNGRPSFAYLMAGLSGLPSSLDLDYDMKQICRVAHFEASKLASAALRKTHAATFDDMHRGIIAAAEVGYSRTVLSRHVVAALKAHSRLIRQNKSEPKKAEVRMEAIKILLEEGDISYDKKDYARWREVFQESGLTHLEQKRGEA